MNTEESEIIDMSNVTESEDMPVCPLCSNEIRDWEPAALIFAHGCKALAHVICIAECRDDD